MRPPTESQIQKQCVAWFRQRYPSVEQLFFAVPNGGNRNKWTAKIMKDDSLINEMALDAIDKSKNYSVDDIYIRWIDLLRAL